MITLSDYIGVWADNPDWTKIVSDNALELLKRVNALLTDYQIGGGKLRINPKTKTHVSGETGGGFRPLNYPVGASKSSHKVGMAVDIYDYDDNLKKWLMRHQDMLIKHDLYLENPQFTDSWVHLQTRKTRNRLFNP